LIDYCATQVTDEQLAGAAIEFPYNSPATKEAFFTGLFYKYYPQTTAAQTVRKWIPKWQENWIQVEEQIRTHAKDTEIAKTRGAFNPLFLFCLDIKCALVEVFLSYMNKC
jgi:asparagine synthase (glutamine-hydrolysing)